MEPLHGGDTSRVFSLHTSTGARVIKINFDAHLLSLFEREADGLSLLSRAHSFVIPKIYAVGKIGKIAYLLLEKIETGTEHDHFWREFATCLVKLHHFTAPRFGLDQDNYIGSLPQLNSSNTSSLATFYIENRLVPQFEKAARNGFALPAPHNLFKVIENSFPDEKPTLIHGDLWSGNFLVSKTGRPVLIDPAPAFCSREMDLAMMQLFGGFPAEVYRHYKTLFPLEKDWEKRVDLWQLYYVLVHLNLFGEAYRAQVHQILQKYR